MSSPRTVLTIAAILASFAGPLTAVARADGQKDELAEGEWSASQDFRPSSGVTEKTVAAPDEDDEEDPASTPPASGGEEEEGGEPEGEDGGAGESPDEGDPALPTDPVDREGNPYGPDGPVPGGDQPCTPEDPISLLVCSARWTYEEEQDECALYDAETLLTLVLFRKDAYAYVCNLYARAESTWYVDWFATTKAQHSGQAKFSVTLKLQGPCPKCNPRIDVEGISTLETKVQATTQWGSLDSETTASASAATTWAAPLECDAACSASAQVSNVRSEYSVDWKGVKIANTATKSYVYAVALGGKGAQKRVNDREARVSLVDKGSVSVYACGTSDNAQAKSRAAYWLRLKGTSECGPAGEYTVDVTE